LLHDTIMVTTQSSGISGHLIFSLQKEDAECGLHFVTYFSFKFASVSQCLKLSRFIAVSTAFPKTL